MAGDLAKHCRVASATATGNLVPQQGRLYGARLVASGAAGAVASAVLYDGDATGPALLALSAVPEDADDWAPGLSLPFTGGLHAVVTGTARLFAYWERQ